MLNTGAPPSMAERALISRGIDLLCCGGASILVVSALLLLPAPQGAAVGAGSIIVVQALWNWPHFMSSYRLLYGNRDSIHKHPWAAVYFPALLAIYSLFAICVWTTQPIHTNVIQWTAALYLARHYTGQTWGMMASFAFVEKVSFAPRERRYIQWGLNLMMVWHVSWAAAQMSPITAPSLVGPTSALYARMAPVAILSALLGLAGLGSMTHRLRRLPPARVLVPWIALYLWYALLAKNPAALFVVQASHALQYLIFPLRVEMNRQAPASQARFIGAQMLGWGVIGLGVILGLPALYGVFYTALGGHLELPGVVAAICGSFVSIHHYFVDGTLYKLRNPEVRKAIFSHLQPAAPLAPATTA